LPAEKSAAPAARPVRDLSELRPKKVAMVLAEKKVRLASVREDADGYQTRRLTLRSDDGQVVCDVALEKLSCFGPGMLVVEDYREAEVSGAEIRPTALAGGELSRPLQSVFSWSKAMDMSLTERVAKLTGEVVAVYRSGNAVVLVDKLKVRPWGQLRSGRNWKILCQEMFVEFDPPEEDTASEQKAAPGGPRVGNLKLFKTQAGKEDYVRVFSGTIEAVCRRILYKRSDDPRDRSKDLAVLYGYLEDERARNAIIYNKDPLSGRLDVMEESSEIIWYPANNRFEARGVKITGGR